MTNIDSGLLLTPALIELPNFFKSTDVEPLLQVYMRI